MDSMGWPCSILLHGQILPFRVMFHALTRYMLLCLWAALSASRKILHPSDEIMWHSSRKTSMIAIVLWVQVVIGSNQRGFSQVKLRPKYESGKLFPFEYGHAATYQGDCQDHWASEWHHNGMSYTKKIPISFLHRWFKGFCHRLKYESTIFNQSWDTNFQTPCSSTIDQNSDFYHSGRNCTWSNTG